MPSIIHNAISDFNKDTASENSITKSLFEEELKDPGDLIGYAKGIISLRQLVASFEVASGLPQEFILFIFGYALGQIRAKAKPNAFELPAGIVKENGTLKFTNTNASLKSHVIGADFPVISDEQERILTEFLVKLIESVEKSEMS